MDKLTDYQKGVLDAVVGVFRTLFEELDEQCVELVLDKLNLQKKGE